MDAKTPALVRPIATATGTPMTTELKDYFTPMNN
jgi:hypothetical protein